ncbi:hypothetical protein LCGC14_2328090 [marine sediment metagenome]|uniref:Uncharacterized protein n=1 Tax=marine sediment metagenome TaxID=412755 RepID=A0A0F9FAP2_9ZZZZ
MSKDEGITTGPYDGPVKKEPKVIFAACAQARMEIKPGPHGSITKYFIDDAVVNRDTYRDYLATLQVDMLWAGQLRIGIEVFWSGPLLVSNEQA